MIVKTSWNPWLPLEHFHKWCKRANGLYAGVPPDRGSRKAKLAGVERTPAHSQLSPHHSVCENALNPIYCIFRQETAVPSTAVKFSILGLRLPTGESLALETKQTA
jgi:hypothetical protein